MAIRKIPFTHTLVDACRRMTGFQADSGPAEGRPPGLPKGSIRLRPEGAAALLLMAAALMRAQEPLNPPVPLAPPPPAVSAGQNGLSLQAASLAQELGFPGIAAAIYSRQLSLPGADRPGLTLELATALLDDGRPAAARQALDGLPSPRGAAWHLRAGLAAAALRRIESAKGELASAKFADLGRDDRPWYFFLQGMLAGYSGEFARAGDFYGQAEAQARTNLARARFQLACDQALMRIGPVTAEEAERTRKNAETYPGSVGYAFARSYAVMLDALGRKSAAIDALQRDLATLPAQERARADDFRLLLGMIAGAADDPGRSALIQLLAGGVDPERQREALQLLARALAQGLGRGFFRAELDKLIGGPAPHPILDDLLLMRAEWALGDSEYLQAEDAAHSLLDRFPGSPLKPYALGILAAAAWEQQHYRTAADYARQTRDALPGGDARNRLNVVIAEAWFRARDYRNAADAYAAVMRNPPAGVEAGDLIFQRVEAEIKAVETGAGTLKAAELSLDEQERNPAFDAIHRWEAEWNLARTLQLDGRAAEAYGRVSRLLAAETPAKSGLSPDLRARMAWLQARLAVDAHDTEGAVRLVDALPGLLGGVDAALRGEIASSSLLLKAQASFDMKREPEALSILNQLRSRYPRSDAAVSSYFVEADHKAQQDKVVEAQQLLTELADHFPQSRYAPYALYQAASMAERLGQDDSLKEADRLLERLVTSYPDQDLVFDARLKQGDLLRRLNQFPQAQQAYEWLINHNYRANPNVIRARLALAECHNAQSGSDPSHEESARILFEDLCEDRVDAPVDVRVEAGYNLGAIYRHRNRPAQAKQVWWGDVVAPFLLDPGRAAELGGKGRFWMAKTLLDLGSLAQQQGRTDEAVQAWQRIIQAGLPGAALARSNLANLNSPAASP